MAIREEFGLSLFGFDVIVPVRTGTYTSDCGGGTGTGAGMGLEFSSSSSSGNDNDYGNDDGNDNDRDNDSDNIDGEKSVCVRACGDGIVAEGDVSYNKFKYKNTIINERTPYNSKGTDTVSGGNRISDSYVNINRKDYGFVDHEYSHNGQNNGFSINGFAAGTHHSQNTETKEIPHCNSDIGDDEGRDRKVEFDYEKGGAVKNEQKEDEVVEKEVKKEEGEVEVVKEEEEGQECRHLRTLDRTESNQVNSKTSYLPANLESCSPSDPRSSFSSSCTCTCKATSASIYNTHSDKQHTQMIPNNGSCACGNRSIMTSESKHIENSREENICHNGNEYNNQDKKKDKNEGENEVKGDDGDFELVVIDVNYFPSYKEVPDFPRRLRKFLRQKAGMPVYT